MIGTGIIRSCRVGPLRRTAVMLDLVRPSVLSNQRRGNHTLPDLPYPYEALEPAISKQIMELHHSKHHLAYVNGLNAAEEALVSALKANDIKKQIELQAAIKFNGGGHINHSIFWKNLLPINMGGGQLKEGRFAQAVKEEFGDLEKLKSKMNATALGIQGSGWVWLGLDTQTKRLIITTTGNQDPLAQVPIIGIDMWEHAFYLQYQNRKADYLAKIWDVIDFGAAEQRYTSAVSV